MPTPHRSWTLLASLALGALAVGFTTPGHATSAALKCINGTALGDWDLPSGAGSGFMSGKLIDDSINQGVFAIEAKLIDVPTPCLSCIQGKIDGVLDDGVGPGPDYIVKGSYSGLFFTGAGTFSAYIYAPWSAAPVGKISGEFKDPPFSPTSVGTFKGTWEICP